MYQQPTHSSALSRLFKVMAYCVVLISAVTTSHAQRLRAPGAPTSNTATRNRPDLYQSLVLPTPSGTVQDIQLLTGPNMTAPRPVSVTIAGAVSFEGLSADSAYTFRARNRNGAGSSAWRTFAFRTAATFVMRSPSPVNLVVSASTATTVTLDWSAPAGVPLGNWTYVYYINGVFQGGTAPQGAYSGSGDNSVITIPRPAAGTAIVFGVAARDANFNNSVPAEIELVQP